MQRDHKLGLALGVLVVGFAAALCFPKQSDVDQRLLQLDRAELDAEIAQLPVHAYTNADPLPAAAPTVPEPATEPLPVSVVPGGDGESELLAGPPAPIAPPIIARESAGDGPDHELPAAMLDHDPADPVPAAQTGNNAPTGQHYTVRPGDTLSSLAAVFLGSHGRYIELYDANRDILVTPDDLKPGMVLVIPETAGRAVRTLPADHNVVPVESTADTPVVEDTAGAPAAADEQAEPRRLFRPAGAQPFLKAQPVSRGAAAPLPPMDASENARTNRASAAEQSDAVRTYTVRRGDTLEGIARKTYGDARAVRDLLDANGNVVRDPRRLKPGMTLTLPERD